MGVVRNRQFSLLGWCIGAILTTMYATLRPDDGMRNLILLTAPLDFGDKDCGSFVKWVDEEHFDVDRILAAFGNMPGEMLDYGAKALKPVSDFLRGQLSPAVGEHRRLQGRGCVARHEHVGLRSRAHGGWGLPAADRQPLPGEQTHGRDDDVTGRARRPRECAS